MTIDDILKNEQIEIFSWVDDDGQQWHAAISKRYKKQASTIPQPAIEFVLQDLVNGERPRPVFEQGAGDTNA